jgi:hypothetical protein
MHGTDKEYISNLVGKNLKRPPESLGVDEKILKSLTKWNISTEWIHAAQYKNQ